MDGCFIKLYIRLAGFTEYIRTLVSIVDIGANIGGIKFSTSLMKRLLSSECLVYRNNNNINNGHYKWTFWS